MDGKIKIIGYTNEPDRITASCARISTTKGDSLAIFENAGDVEKNRSLVKKVLASGHKTVIEHISFNLAFVNVSAYVEQFMLEFRLASFTVKSRRYVDFSNMGFVEPAFVDCDGKPLKNAPQLRERYQEHMAYLFREYGDFVEAGIPKEDARFLLPYSYKSNFYCTVNARELCNVLYSMVYGRGRNHTEIRTLGEDLLRQAAELCPFIFGDLSAMESGEEKKAEKLAGIIGEAAGAEDGIGIPGGEAANAEDDIGMPGTEAANAGNDIKCKFNKGVELLDYTSNPERAVARAALIGQRNLTGEKINSILNNEETLGRIVRMVLSERRPRELEQINFTFRINGITLAAITHLTRHRMQALIVPPFSEVCRCERYVEPETVRADEGLLRRYRDAYAKTKELYTFLAENGLNKYEISYLYLSGNEIDVTTTMNGRELRTFLGLRTCSRTQWETRRIAVQMLNLLREASPLLFGHFGPRCFLEGGCPEGKMTCGKYAEMQQMFQAPKVALP